MAVPSLSSYTMPKSYTFPSNKVGWHFEPQRAALLIHDMQQYFLSFYPLNSTIVGDLVSAIQELRAYCRLHKIPVIYTAQPVNQSPTERGLLNDMWGRGIDSQPELEGIVPELLPEAADLVLTKWRYSAFQKSDLEAVLKSMGKDQLVITGVYGHIGCLMTAANAFMLNIKAFMVGDAIADFSLEDHQQTLNYIAGRCGKVISKAEILSACTEV